MNAYGHEIRGHCCLLHLIRFEIGSESVHFRRASSAQYYNKLEEWALPSQFTTRYIMFEPRPDNSIIQETLRLTQLIQNKQLMQQRCRLFKVSKCPHSGVTCSLLKAYLKPTLLCLFVFSVLFVLAIYC